MAGCLTHESQTVILILYDGKFSEGENFHEFQGFVAIGESFLRKILECGILLWHQRAICRSFLHKILIRKSFLPQEFPLYGIQDHLPERDICTCSLLPWQHHCKREMNNILVCCLGNKSYSPGLDGQMNIQSDRVTC